MKIAMAQINPTVGDFNGNMYKIIHEMTKARSLGVELVVFPEMSISGYPPKDNVYIRSFLRDNKDCLERAAAESSGIHAVVGFVDYDDGKTGNDGRVAKYNAAALVGNGKLIGVQHKTLLPTYDVFDEWRYFIPADSHQVFDVNGVRLGIEICEDLWDENYSTKVTDMLGQDGADLVVNISASPFYIGKRAVRESLLRERAMRNNVPIFYANMVGGQDDLVFDGESMAVDRKGNLIAVAKKFEEDLLIVDFDTNSRTCVPVTPPHYDKTAEIHNALVLGTRDYCRKSRFRGGIIGISGGIDSAVTTAIAVQALGKENVIGAYMPSQNSSQHSREDAQELAVNLGIRHEAISISEAFDAVKISLASAFSGYEEDVTEENIQARLRGIDLMALSNKYKDFLVLSTGNKSELSVGYCTLYGDMCGGYAVLSDVFKTTVYKLARYINRNGIIIPVRSITKPPSAELKPGQTDQDTLPPYEILDEILIRYIEEEKGVEDIIADGYSPDTVRWVLNAVDSNEWKRQQMARGPKISRRAFGTGRQMPIVNRYRR